jgi:hypothetical protein
MLATLFRWLLDVTLTALPQHIPDLPLPVLDHANRVVELVLQGACCFIGGCLQHRVLERVNLGDVF